MDNGNDPPARMHRLQVDEKQKIILERALRKGSG